MHCANYIACNRLAGRVGSRFATAPQNTETSRDGVPDGAMGTRS